MRCCWIGVHVGLHIGLPARQQWELWCRLLFKDLGCSSNAVRICNLYLADDLTFKRDFKAVGDSLLQVLRFVCTHTGLGAGMHERFSAVTNILQNGPQIARELIETRCQRGSDIARQLHFREPVASGIRSLDEHCNGRGKPQGLPGDAIPLYSRIALLAQVVDVFRTAAGPAAALHEARARTGQWFDPVLVAALEQVGRDPAFWAVLDSPALDQAALEPGHSRVLLDDDHLDDIALAFGQIIDAKSPFTSGHSERVAG